MNNIDYEHNFNARSLVETFDRTLLDPKAQIKRVVMMQLEGWLAAKDFEERVRQGDVFKIRLQCSSGTTGQTKRDIKVVAITPVNLVNLNLPRIGSKWKLANTSENSVFHPYKDAVYTLSNILSVVALRRSCDGYESVWSNTVLVNGRDFLSIEEWATVRGNTEFVQVG